MGKNQHSKDRMFITATEHAGLYGGYKKKKTIGLTGALPFDCCALSLLPFDSPVCARDGILFDALQLLPYVQEKGVSPATGKKLTVKDVLRLKMAKNQDNQWHCPVTCKVFTNHSKVVCIATTGNVFSKDAVKELCFKRNCLEDLLDATPFKKEDVISLHDPDDKDLVSRRDLANFWHLQEERKKRDAELGSKGSFKQTDAQKEVLAEAKRNVEAREAQRMCVCGNHDSICSMAWRMPIPYRRHRRGACSMAFISTQAWPRKRRARRLSMRRTGPRTRASRRRICESDNWERRRTK